MQKSRRNLPLALLLAAVSVGATLAAAEIALHPRRSSAPSRGGATAAVT